MYKNIAGIWVTVLMILCLFGLVLPALISTNQVPVYVIIAAISGLFCMISFIAVFVYARFTKKENPDEEV